MRSTIRASRALFSAGCLGQRLSSCPHGSSSATERHWTMALVVYFDVPFETVFEHREPFESVPQITNEVPEHRGNQVFSTEWERGRRNVRFVGANCGKRASVQGGGCSRPWQLSVAIPVAARPVWQIKPILPPQAQPARQSRARQLPPAAPTAERAPSAAARGEVWELDANR